MNGVLLSALLLGAAPISTEPRPPAASSSVSALAPVPANASTLAALLNPEQGMVAVAVRVFETGFHGAIEQGAGGSEVFAEFPGLAEAIVERCRPLVAKYTRDSVPAVQDKSARFFMSRFSPAEIDQLLLFYRSPVGTKVIAGMFAGVDGADVAADIVDRESGEVKSADISKLVGSALMRIAPSFTQDDKAALIAFGTSPVGRKMNSLTPEIMAFNTQIANEPDPELDAALDKVIEEVTTDFITRHEATKRTG